MDGCPGKDPGLWGFGGGKAGAPTMQDMSPLEVTLGLCSSEVSTQV